MIIIAKVKAYWAIDFKTTTNVRRTLKLNSSSVARKKEM